MRLYNRYVQDIKYNYFMNIYNHVSMLNYSYFTNPTYENA